MTADITIIIVGSGIAGLAAAIALSLKGLKVTVLEAKPSLNEFGASIGILPNGVRILKAWGLKEAFQPVTTQNGMLDFRRGTDNERLGWLLHNEKHTSEILYGSEVWNIHRADYQQTLAKAAQDKGAQILFDANVVKVDVENAVVHLEDGRKLKADLIIGADGNRSACRLSIPAVAEAEIISHSEQCYRCTVPKSAILGNPNLEWLITDGYEMGFLHEGKYVLTWPLPEDKPFDVVCGLQGDSGVPPGKWGVKGDPVEMRKEFQDFSPTVRELLENIEGCVRWQLASLPPLSTCRSENGRVVLMGDAWHAMIPHAASGGVSAIEDAAVLAECLAWTYSRNNSPSYSPNSDESNHDFIARSTSIYETLRKPRVERMQSASQEGFGFLGAQGEKAVARDKMLAAVMEHESKELALPEEERRKKKLPPADMYAPFPSPQYLQWSYQFDAIAETRNYLDGLGA